MLKFIIDNYYHLPAQKLVFIHEHETSWHSKTNVNEVLNMLIQSESFKTHDYGGIYRNTWHHSNYFFLTNEKVGYDHRKLFSEIYANTSVYNYIQLSNVSFHCCTTFYISSTLIRKKRLSEYQLIRDRLLNWAK